MACQEGERPKKMENSTTRGPVGNGATLRQSRREARSCAEAAPAALEHVEEVERDVTRAAAGPTNYVQGSLFKAFVVRDGRLVTGQQQYSGAKVGEAVIAALGV